MTYHFQPVCSIYLNPLPENTLLCLRRGVIAAIYFSGERLYRRAASPGICFFFPERDRLLQSSPPLSWRFDVINIVMDSINENLFLNPRQKRSSGLRKTKLRASAFGGSARSFMMWHVLGCFCTSIFKCCIPKIVFSALNSLYVSLSSTAVYFQTILPCLLFFLLLYVATAHFY